MFILSENRQGNFFQNIGSICVFAIFGTIVNAVVIGAGVYLLGLVRNTSISEFEIKKSFVFTVID